MRFFRLYEGEMLEGGELRRSWSARDVTGADDAAHDTAFGKTGGQLSGSLDALAHHSGSTSQRNPLQGDANLQTSYSEEEVLALLVHGSPIRTMQTM